MFEIAKVGHQRFAKTFKDIKLGKKWAKKIEHEIEIGSYEDLTLASKTTIKSLLIKYRDEITLNKKGYREETSKLNLSKYSKHLNLLKKLFIYIRLFLIILFQLILFYFYFFLIFLNLF